MRTGEVTRGLKDESNFQGRVGADHLQAVDQLAYRIAIPIREPLVKTAVEDLAVEVPEDNGLALKRWQTLITLALQSAMCLLDKLLPYPSISSRGLPVIG